MVDLGAWLDGALSEDRGGLGGARIVTSLSDMRTNTINTMSINDQPRNTQLLARCRAHQLGQISTAVQAADIETMANRAAHISGTFSLGMS